MARPMSYQMANALKSGAPLVMLAEIEHPNGTARFWTGVGTLLWDGQEWTGAGVLGTITPIKQTSEIAIQEIQFSLAGVDASVLARLNDDVRNLEGVVWLACLDDHGAVVPDPMQIVQSQLDFQSNKITEDGVTVITITGRTGFYTLERAIHDVWSSEDQKTRYPDDFGLDDISSLQNQELIWAPN